MPPFIPITVTPDVSAGSRSGVKEKGPSTPEFFTLPSRLADLFGVRRAGDLDRGGDDEAGVIGLRGKLVRRRAIFGLIGGDEFLVDRIGLADEPGRADERAVGGLAGDLADLGRVESIAADHAHLGRNADGLLAEQNARARLDQCRDDDGVGVERLDLGELGRKSVSSAPNVSVVSTSMPSLASASFITS